MLHDVYIYEEVVASLQELELLILFNENYHTRYS